MYTKTSDFKQKRRNRPLAITDIAISKVRRTRLYGFDTEQEAKIQQYHKEVLSRAQYLNNRNNSKEMEVGMLVDLHTWNHWLIDGGTRVVEMKSNPVAYQYFLHASRNQLLFMHNHPSTGTFSGEDFKFFCLHDVFYIMTVVGNNGDIYVLRKKEEFDISVLAEYTKLANSYYEKGYTKNNGTLALRDILRNASKYGLEYKKGSHK